MTGTVVFSLDFELGWGHTDIRPEYIHKLRARSDESFERLRSLIDVFDKYGVSATWAVVGKLTEAGDDPLFHNPGLFEYLLDTDVEHDIGSHSYEHPLFTDLSKRDAQEDIKAGRDALTQWGIFPRSFVYPRGQISHTDILIEQQFESYRTKSSDSKFQSLLQELIPPTIPSPLTDATPTPIPATQYLAARRPAELIRLNMKRSIHKAVRKNQMIHFWLHPHNVYAQPKLFDIVEEGLEIVADYSNNGEIECLTMADLQA